LLEDKIASAKSSSLHYTTFACILHELRVYYKHQRLLLFLKSH